MGQQKNLSYEQEQIIIRAYVEEGRGQLYCAKLVGTSARVVKRVLHKYGIDVRNFSEAAARSNMNRRKKVDDNFFSIPSHKMAYVMGFIAADGHIHEKGNTIELALSSIDKDFLSMIREEMGIEKEVKISQTSNGYEQCRLQFSSQKIKKDLESYGIFFNKTYNLELPSLPKEYIIDFIRGFFDGDGSVSTAGPHAIRWQLCSASIKILQQIVEFLYKEYEIPSVSIQTRSPKNPQYHNLYYIQYSSTPTRRIFEVLYPKNCLYLLRKYEKFKSII